MSRRFWVGPRPDRPAGGGRDVGPDPRPAAPARGLAARARLAPAPAGDARRDLVRRALLRARLGVHRESQPEHVHADRARDRHRVRLQRGRHARPGLVPARHARPRGTGRRLLRGRGGHHRSRAAGPGAGAPRPGPHERRAPRAAEPRADDRARHPGRPAGGGRAARPGGRERPASRAAGRADPGRRRRSRGAERRRRVDDHRGGDARREGARGSGDGRHRQRGGRLRDAGRASRPGHAAGPDRPAGRRGAAEPRADPAPGRPRVRLLRAGRGGRGAPERRSSGEPSVPSRVWPMRSSRPSPS